MNEFTQDQKNIIDDLHEILQAAIATEGGEFVIDTSIGVIIKLGETYGDDILAYAMTQLGAALQEKTPLKPSTGLNG